MKAEIIYEDMFGKKHSKEIKLPVKRYQMGITKQREGYVEIGYFTEPATTHRFISSYKFMHVTLPFGAKDASARLKIGKRVVSRAK